MPLRFSPFYPLNALARIQLDGKLSREWRGEYTGPPGYLQPEGRGSGLSVGALKLLPDLPAQVSDSLAIGWVYVLASTSFPILYVGISQKSLEAGVFGHGRLAHHLRKLLAAPGAGTHHVGPWQWHARARYEWILRCLSPDAPNLGLDELAPRLMGDVRIALAHTPRPQDHELGTLTQVAKRLADNRNEQVEILNTKARGLRTVDIDDFFPEIPARDELREIMHVPGFVMPRDEAAMLENQPVAEPEEGANGEEDPEEVNPLNFLNNVFAARRQLFEQLLAWVRGLRATVGLQEKIIGGYTGQPSGCDNKLTLLFAELDRRGKAIRNSWIARFPLEWHEGPTIVLSTRSLPTPPPAEVARGRDENYRPLDASDFLRRPGYYTTLE